MRFQISIIGVALLMSNPQIRAQELGLEYDTELQANFRGDYNWANLLRLNGSLDISQKLSIEMSTISIACTAQEPIVDDLQGYSNIEEENLPLGIAVLGAEYRTGLSTIFLGIRNVNEDYFTSDVTSLFVNSSCGIFPTISGNYDIANYPLSSWTIHYKAQWDHLALQTSLYEGLGHRRLYGHDNIFTMSPRRNGLFSITSAEYDNNDSNYVLGCAIYYGVHNSDETFIETETSQTSAETSATKSLSFAPWLNIEQRVTDECSVMFQVSYSTSRTNCRCYFGVGTAYKFNNATLGIFADYAKYNVCSEIATELTCHIPLTPATSVQPAMELIRTGANINTVGILRFKIEL